MKSGKIFDYVKQSSVTRTVVPYTVIAVGVIDVAGNILPHLGVPGWALTMIVLAALLGLPVALLIVSHHDKNRTTAQRALWARRSLVYAAPLVVLVAAYLLARRPIFDRIESEQANAATAPAAATAVRRVPPASIAVLPFTDLSPNRDHEYFSDGMTEELTMALSLLPGVKVAARTSAGEFKNRPTNVSEIARQLNVATVLEGSVRRAGESLRVTAQWIDARDGYHLWAHNFDARLTDVFAIQDSIARAIAQTLGGRLVALDTSKESSRATEDALAYDLYLKGRHLQKKGDSASVAEAIDVLNRAVARDPKYTIAHRTLAAAYTTQARSGDTTAYAKARAATRRAQVLINAPVTAAAPAPAARPAAFDSLLSAALAANDRAAAMRLIEAAVADGTITIDELRTDSIYNPLRRNIRFAKLLSSARN